MTVDDIYQLVNFICNKKQSGSIAPTEFNRLMSLINLDMFKVYAGLPEQYQPNGTPPPRGWQMNNRITDTISFLLKPVFITRDATTKYFKKPANYAAFSSALYPYIKSQEDCDEGEALLAWKRIEQVTDGERTDRLDSFLIPPTIKRPILSWYEQGAMVDPQSINRILLHYLRLPKTPVRAYTGNDVYNPAGSVQVEYPDTVHNDFIIRICEYVGIFISKQELIQFANARKLRGE